MTTKVRFVRRIALWLAVAALWLGAGAGTARAAGTCFCQAFQVNKSMGGWSGYPTDPSYFIDYTKEVSTEYGFSWGMCLDKHQKDCKARCERVASAHLPDLWSVTDEMCANARSHQCGRGVNLEVRSYAGGDCGKNRALVAYTVSRVCKEGSTYEKFCADYHPPPPVWFPPTATPSCKCPNGTLSPQCCH